MFLQVSNRDAYSTLFIMTPMSNNYSFYLLKLYHHSFKSYNLFSSPANLIFVFNYKIHVFSHLNIETNGRIEFEKKLKIKLSLSYYCTIISTR